MKILKITFVLPLIAGLMICLSSNGRAQPADAKTPEVLPLEKAIGMALRNNPELKNASLGISKTQEQLAATRTRRLPSFHLGVFGSQQLRPIDFTFNRGVFGDFPLIGPVPGGKTVISTPLRPTAVFLGRISQPLSQLYRIHLNIGELNLNRNLAQEKLREQQHQVIEQVKQAYFAILQTQSGLRSAQQNVKLYREVDRVTREYVLHKVVLKSDSLEVKMQLAKAEYDALTLGDQLATQKEKLNRLLGRDALADFTVAPAGKQTDYTVDLAAARRRALANRPELRAAQLRIKQAEWERRVTKSRYIPDARLIFQYISPRNFNDIVPRNIAELGVTVNWEVFDWGRKRHKLNEDDLTIAQSKNGLQDAKTAVLIDVDASFRKLREARQLLKIAQLSQQTTAERMRVITDRYHVQASLIKDVLQAQAKLQQANYQYQTALSAYWTAKAEFEKAIGADR